MRIKMTENFAAWTSTSPVSDMCCLDKVVCDHFWTVTSNASISVDMQVKKLPCLEIT